MKIRTSLHAGARAAVPKRSGLCEKLLDMEARVRNCRNYNLPPTVPTAPPVVGGSYTYPDRSGWCG